MCGTSYKSYDFRSFHEWWTDECVSRSWKIGENFFNFGSHRNWTLVGPSQWMVFRAGYKLIFVNGGIFASYDSWPFSLKCKSQRGRKILLKLKLGLRASEIRLSVSLLNAATQLSIIGNERRKAPLHPPRNSSSQLSSLFLFPSSLQ